MPEPPALYDHGPGTSLDVDGEFYGRLARDVEGRSQVERFVIPVRSGRAWTVRASCTART